METRGMDTELDIPADIRLRCQQRDVNAFRVLVEQLKRPAWRHAQALLGNSDDALEISQDAFTRAWQAIDSYDPQLPFYPWYYTILKRLALNLLRSRQRHPEHSLDEVDESVLPEMSDTPEQQLISAQTKQQVQQALMALSADDREILCLKELHDYAYRDIGLMLGIPVGTVMSRLYTARQRMREQLKVRGCVAPERNNARVRHTRIEGVAYE